MATSRALDDPDSTRDDVVDSGSAAGEPFDAFDASTWDLHAPTVPWYQTRQAMATATVTAVAAMTLVVSAVLLAFRGPPAAEVPLVENSTTVGSSAPTTPTATALNTPLPAPPPPTDQVPPPAVPVIARVPVIAGPGSNREPPPTHAKRMPMQPRPTGVTVRATPFQAP